jgi:hypothetical protein
MYYADGSDMELDFAVLAESADLGSNGVLQLFRGGLGNLIASTFPTIAQYAVAVRVAGCADDAGTEHEISINLVKNGSQQQGVPVRFSFGATNGETIPLSVTLIVQAGIELPAEGPYSFAVVLDGKTVRTIPFTAQRAQQEKQDDDALRAELAETMPSLDEIEASIIGPCRPWRDDTSWKGADNG